MSLHIENRQLWALVAAAPMMAAISTGAYAQTWKINLRDADLAAFINEVADITGKNFAVDPRVRGNVTVISNKALTKDQVYDLFLGVLNVNGVVAIPSGNTIKLVPDNNVKNSGIPYDARNNASGDQIVTRIIWLDNTNPNDLIPALRPLMPQFANLAAVPGTNALIVSDRAANIYQLETIIRNLDGTGENDIEAIALQASQAEEILGLIDSMSATGAAKDLKGSRVRVIADTRTNRILIKGDTGSRKRIRQLIEMLDVPSANRLGGLQVFRLKHANAKNLAEILQGLVTGQAVNSSTNNSSSGSNNSVNSLLNNNSGTSSTSTSSGSLINLSGSNNNNNQNALTSFNGNGVSIIADATQNALVVKADPQLMREIESAIQQLDIRRQQVLIEAAILEVSGTNADQLGVQWALGDLSSGVGLINFSNAGASLASLAAGYLGGSTTQATALTGMSNGATVGIGDYKRNSDGTQSFFGILVQALESSNKTNLLSAPSVVTMDNEEAYIVVGENVPFVTGSVSTTNGTANPYTTIERKDVGITLKVVPQIGEGGTIRLQVEQEVSAVTDDSSASDIITSKRAIKTAILAEDGQTIVLGGLIKDDRSQGRQSVPGLGRIPVVGRLFRSDNTSTEKRNLLVFIHPTIIRDDFDSRNVTRQRYGQLRSLQLAFDTDGSFATLPDDANDLYQQRITVPIPKEQQQNGKKYQTIPVTPTASNSTTTVDLRPQANTTQSQPVVTVPAQPQVNVERTANTETQTQYRLSE
ncbi:MAG: type II secretion system secretin GspD [Acinetobacter populi]|jgi:general secretion pathway protein D|uniref:type II secretion system secretin GspD n=1 Tax=Acinetobacter populi TaxID=1582270 RepID=UPI0023534466|nr:type II secretion system secretin GspD [Acinetobacter populi]MCH4248126.1 type II secretion system secretin GspD [Acinetobacter populi]